MYINIINNKSDYKGDKKELYSIKDDLYESNNLIEKYNQKAISLERKLYDILAKQPKFEQKNNQSFPTWINEDQRKKLIETGYF